MPNHIQNNSMWLVVMQVYEIEMSQVENLSTFDAHSQTWLIHIQNKNKRTHLLLCIRHWWVQNGWIIKEIRRNQELANQIHLSGVRSQLLQTPIKSSSSSSPPQMASTMLSLPTKQTKLRMKSKTRERNGPNMVPDLESSTPIGLRFSSSRSPYMNSG